MSEAYDYGDHCKVEASEGSLEQLTALAIAQRELEGEIALAEDEVKRLETLHRRLAEVQIPELMQELGMEKFTLSDGFEVGVKEKWRVSIPQKNMAECVAFLDANEASGLVKRKFEIVFTKEEEKFARKFQRDCGQRKNALPMTETSKVESGTAKKWIINRMANGEAVDLSLFGAYRQRVAKVVAPKGKR